MPFGKSLNAEFLWWEEITGPARLVTDIEAALSDGCSIVCNTAAAMPFNLEFREIISHWMSSRDVSAEYVDCSGSYNGEDVMEFLLRCLRSSRLNDYRRRRSIQYIREQKVFKDKFLWISGVEPQYYDKWIRFMSDFNSRDIHGGLLLLQTEKVPGVLIPENVKYFSCRDHVRRDDLRLYASVLAESYFNAPTGVKQYAVELVTSLCMTDGELANQLLQCRLDLVRCDPLDILRRVAARYDEETTEKLDPDHALALLRDGRETELTYRIRTAQIRVGYPHIELERLNLIRQNYEILRDALQHSYLSERNRTERRFTDYEGNVIENPFELEVGMLVKLTDLVRFHEPNRQMFRMPSVQAMNRLLLLRDCRNKLAHQNVCDPEMFYNLVSREEFS